MANDLLIILFHLIGFMINGFGLWYDIVYINVHVPEEPKPTGKWVFLTFWSMVVQTAYFGYALINDIFGSNLDASHLRRHCSALQRVRDSLLASFAWPLGVFVMCTFWGIYAVDRELIFPRHLDEFIPGWLNHIMHSTALPLLLIEKYIVYHHYPQRVTGIARTLLIGLTYIVVIFCVLIFSNFWVYPIFAVLSWPQRAVFVAVLCMLLVTVYLLGEFLTNFFWVDMRRSVKFD